MMTTSIGTNNTFNAYIDGACSKNPGKGGWAAVIRSDRFNVNISGKKDLTTNNEMELLAALKAIENIIGYIDWVRIKHIFINIYSDSAYVVNSVNQKWIDRWNKNNWQTIKQQDVSHSEIWKRIYFYLIQTDKYKINFIKVKGHSNIELNELADKLAKDRIRE